MLFTQWNGGRFSVAGWLVDPGAHEISRAGTTVRLEPRVMRLLVALAARAGSTVTRDELRRSVWDGEHVEPNALNRSVSQLRKALGDDARDPRVVKTIPRRGYRLDAAVTTPEETPPRPSWARSARARLITACAVGVVIIAAALRPWSGDAVTPLATRPLTSLRGLETWPALAPDAGRVAFVWSGGRADEHGLYVQEVPDGPSQLIFEGRESVASPVWSPDGARLAFLATSETRCTVMAWAADGRTEELASCAPGTRQGLAWAPDRGVVAIAEPTGTDRETSIVLISTEDGTRTSVTTPPEGTLGDGEPVFHPSGGHLAFTRYSSRTHHDLYVLDLRSGEVRAVTRDGRFLAGHTWTPDGAHLVFSSNRSGNFRLWRVPRDGGVPEWLNISAYDPGRPSVAAAGAGLVYSEWFFEYNIWLAAPDSATGALLPRRIIASTRWDRQPQWAPDGRHLAFVSDRTGNDELWVSDPEGKHPTMLTRFGDRPVSTPAWAPDGKRLAFHVTTGGVTDVFTTDLDGQRTRRLTTHPGSDEVPSWSPDGHSILFASDRSGRWETYRVAVADGRIEQVTTNGGYYARQAADGHVFFTRFARPGLWRMRSDGTGGDSLPIPLAAEDWGNWSITGRGVLFVERRGTRSAIASWDWATGSVTPRLGTARAIPYGAGQFSMDPSGNLVYSQTDRAESDLRLVDGFGRPPS